MHTLKIEIFDPPGQALATRESIRQGIQGMLHLVPFLRRRVVFVPFRLHHPVLIEDPDFDLDFHISQAAIPAPGGRDELDAMVAQIACHALDRDRPLWEYWLLSGYDGGKVVGVHKIHHALADGMASVRFLTRAFGASTAATQSDWRPEPLPSTRRLLWDALVDHIKYDAKNFPTILRELYRSYRRIRAHKEAAEESPVMDIIANPPPRTRWNRALTPKRVFATRQIELNRARQFKNSLDASVNDVVMAMVASAVRNYLIHHDELPDRTLVCSVPVGVDEPGTDRDWGNKVASLSSCLWTNVVDPIDRFRAVQKSTRAGKEEFEALGRDAYGNLLQYLPPFLTTWMNNRNYRKRTANDAKYKPMTNLIISNVPGPREQFAGDFGRLVDLFSMGVLIEGCGLNVTVWSYAGNLNFSLMGCLKAVPDIALIADGLEAGLEELERATSALGT